MEAVEWARNESRPFFIEAMAYRFRGHSMADPAEYRTKMEEEQWRTKDPITTIQGAAYWRTGS